MYKNGSIKKFSSAKLKYLILTTFILKISYDKGNRYFTYFRKTEKKI